MIEGFRDFHAIGVRSKGRHALVFRVIGGIERGIGRKRQTRAVGVDKETRSRLCVQTRVGHDGPVIGKGLDELDIEHVGLNPPAVIVVAIARFEGGLTGLKMVIPLAHQGVVGSVSRAQIKDLVGVREIPLPHKVPQLQLSDVVHAHDLCHTQDEVKGLFGLVGHNVIGGIDLIAVGGYACVPSGVFIFTGFGEGVKQAFGQVVHFLRKTASKGLRTQGVVVRRAQLQGVALIVHISQSLCMVGGRSAGDGVGGIGRRHRPLA